jgi:hypothetical protein
VTDHGRESAFGRRQNVLMSRWVAGHDRVSVLMRVLERRLVHFKAHPWPATTGQVFKSTFSRFDQRKKPHTNSNSTIHKGTKMKQPTRSIQFAPILI